MTNAAGLGTGTHMSAYLSWQNAEHSRHRPNYGGQSIPKELREGLPGTIVQYVWSVQLCPHAFDLGSGVQPRCVGRTCAHPCLRSC